ncbi:MAG: transposase, partial [Phototrophicales bacterium]
MIIVELRKTYKFRLYENDANVYLHQQIDIAGLIWNHALGLSRRYYRLYGKSISFTHLQKHIAKLRKSSERFCHYQVLGSQAV